MSQLFGWVPGPGPAARTDRVPTVDAMAAALRTDRAQRIACWQRPGLEIGVVEPPRLAGEPDDLEPATSRDGRFWLWMSGEAFCSADPALTVGNASQSRTANFRRALLERWLQQGVEAIRALDGEYHIAVWDARDRILTLANDRFGGLPMYWARSPQGVAFAGGVRGVLMAPGVAPDPDHDALREAVTFGGYRLGTRTNVKSARMVEGASIQIIRDGQRTSSRYWTWNDIRPEPARDIRDLIVEMDARWKLAVARRTTDSARYGQTLSGGLDSRAVLAEAANVATCRPWTAITYGVPGCDDGKYARRAAAAAGASWVFLPLYAGDWLSVRSSHIQATDGLIELGDLMHLESLPLQRERFDVHLSGYIGDAVSGPTFGSVDTAEQVLLSLPYYGATISLEYPVALARVSALVAELGQGPPRYTIFEHKLPQSTNRWTAAWRPWLRVRKPFVDYEFFDFCQGLPVHVRTAGRLHERWLRASYPACFASIPNQKTGVPVLASNSRVQAARIARGLRARLADTFSFLPGGWHPAPRFRSYHDNDRVWRQPDVVERILSPLSRTDALCAQVFGADRVRDLAGRWKTFADAPAQVIGALYVYETYHTGLNGALREAHAAAERVRRPTEVSSGTGH